MILCPKSKEPVIDKGEYYLFPGFPHVKCYKTVAKAKIAGRDYIRVLQGHSPLFLFYSATRENFFEARLHLDTATNEFRFEYETSNPPPTTHARTQFQDYLKVVYPSWQYNPQKLNVHTLPVIEYRVGSTGQIEPRAVVEFVRLDKSELAAGLKAAVLERHQKDTRCRISQDLARELGVNYYLILHTKCVTKFAIINLTDPGSTWLDVDTDGLQTFYEGLT